MNKFRAEVIAIGDELTSGVRLDTNSQWISKKLEEMGLHVAFQTTVGDDLADLELAFASAVRRADVVVCTGGLGPTADDLTRQIIASVGGVPLQLNSEVLDHIETMYRKRNRSMPPNNEIQAWFPEGSRIIPNPEGTAPGIEFEFSPAVTESSACHLFALPGVPAEMKQMWERTVESRLRECFDIRLTTWHHTLHCFGTGESAVEQMLPDLIQRGRDPLVGITASAATISLRVSTRAATVEQCQSRIEPTLNLIRERLGEMVYGENGEELEQAVVAQLMNQNLSISVFDFGLHGEVARRLAHAHVGDARMGSEVLSVGETRPAPTGFSPLEFLAERTLTDDEIALVIGPIDRDHDRVQQGESSFVIGFSFRGQIQHHEFRYIGHSSWREVRAVKQVLNALRLAMAATTA